MQIVKKASEQSKTAKTVAIYLTGLVPDWARNMVLEIQPSCGTMVERDRAAKKIVAILEKDFKAQFASSGSVPAKKAPVKPKAVKKTPAKKKVVKKAPAKKKAVSRKK